MKALLLIAGVLLAASSQADEAKLDGKGLFESRCVACHQLPEPDMLNQRQWLHVMNTMQKRMQQAGMPPLNNEEFNAISAYLGERAR